MPRVFDTVIIGAEMGGSHPVRVKEILRGLDRQAEDMVSDVEKTGA